MNQKSKVARICMRRLCNEFELILSLKFPIYSALVFSVRWCKKCWAWTFCLKLGISTV